MGSLASEEVWWLDVGPGPSPPLGLSELALGPSVVVTPTEDYFPAFQGHVTQRPAALEVIQHTRFRTCPASRIPKFKSWGKAHW